MRRGQSRHDNRGGILVVYKTMVEHYNKPTMKECAVKKALQGKK